MSTKNQAKRVNIVSLKVVKEASILYQNRRVSSPQDAAKLVEPFLLDCDREKFLIACLDTRNQPTSISTVSIGTLNESPVHPREVFKLAILSNAASVLVFHNHPGGDPSPSPADKETTKRLVESGSLLGINVLDHIIIAEKDRYCSMKEQGLM